MKPIALVTGASSPIGRAIALRLACEGHHLLVHFHRNESGAAQTGEAIDRQGGSHDKISFDVTRPDEIEARLETYFRACPDEQRFRVLVNNAGLRRDAAAGLMSDAQFLDVMQANAHGPFYLMRWAVRRMIRQREGCIVNVASLAGQTGNPGQINYAASKGALLAMTKTLALEVASRGIRVNAVSPGFVESGMLDGVPRDAVVSRIPLGRLGSPEDVAGAVAFLCSADAAYVTGQTLAVNGGLFPA